ncbi:hypothetical protein J6590_040623 [Homalodisca vitripennis]|nr:hypothetical protein J6590_040623 [Homalodisca vitripennis]
MLAKIYNWLITLFYFYLTYRGFLQTMYFVIVSFSDIVDSLPTLFRCPRWSHYCFTIRHYLLTSLVLPLTLYIFAVFWTFFLYDREAIYPELFDRFIPPWLNHAMHSFPVPIVIVHLIICPNHNPSRKSALVGLTLLFVVYGVIFWQSVMRGNWVYLLFNHLNPSQRMLLLSVSYPLNIFFLILSRWLNSLVKVESATHDYVAELRVAPRDAAGCRFSFASVGEAAMRAAFLRMTSNAVGGDGFKLKYSSKEEKAK